MPNTHLPKYFSPGLIKKIQNSVIRRETMKYNTMGKVLRLDTLPKIIHKMLNTNAEYDLSLGKMCIKPQ